jgi:hypothetical protein
MANDSNTDLMKRFRAVDEAVSRLVTSDFVNGRYRIGLPITTGAGSLIDVSVRPEASGNFIVSDEGATLSNAIASGIDDRSVIAVSNVKAAAYGAKIKTGKILFSNVPADRLHGAVIAMGSLLKEVADEVLARHAKVVAASLREALFVRLDKAFGYENISHDVTFFGESTADYRVDAVADVSGKKLVFQSFSDDPNSIASTFTKLSDINRLEEPPRLVGVTSNPDKIGPKLQLIASVASIVAIGADDPVYKQLAA